MSDLKRTPGTPGQVWEKWLEERKKKAERRMQERD